MLAQKFAFENQHFLEPREPKPANLPVFKGNLAAGPFFCIALCKSFSFLCVLTHLFAYPLIKVKMADNLKKKMKSWSKNANFFLPAGPHIFAGAGIFFFAGYPDFAYS